MYIEVGWVTLTGLPPAKGHFTGLEVSHFPGDDVVDKELHTHGQNDPHTHSQNDSPDDIGSSPLADEETVKNGIVLV